MLVVETMRGFARALHQGKTIKEIARTECVAEHGPEGSESERPPSSMNGKCSRGQSSDDGSRT